MHLFNPVIPNLSIESPINKVKIMSKFLAEFIGTYALVFFGTRAIIVNQEASGVVTNVGIAIIFGLIVMARHAPTQERVKKNLPYLDMN